MKKLKFLVLVSLLLTTGLTGCKINAGSNPSSIDPSTSDVTPSSEDNSSSSSEDVHEHTFSDEYSYDETYHWFASTCGHDVVKDKEEHTFDVVVTEPTREEGGYTTHTCSICGYSFVDSETDPIPAPEFPSKDVIAFFEEAGLDVVVPNYEIASLNGDFEVDDSYEGYFDVYAIDTTSAELVAYKDALKADGWVVISDDEETAEDFELQFADTAARVALLDYTAYAEEDEAPYNLISFYVKQAAPEYTAASAIDAVADLLTEMLSSPVTASHNANGDYIVLNFGSSIDAATMKLYSDYFFVPEGFEKQGDWVTDAFSDGTPVDYVDYICGAVALEYLVYEVDDAQYGGLYYQVQAFTLLDA